MKTLDVGSPAPVFELIANNGRIVSLKDYLGLKNIVLYFYPKDDTPGCIKEACGFREVMSELYARGTVILGVSADNMGSHQKFVAKYALPFLLLCDETKSICKQYGVWGEKNFYGKKLMGIKRTTFVIDREGKIIKIFHKVKAETHAQEILSFVKSLSGQVADLTVS